MKNLDLGLFYVFHQFTVSHGPGHHFRILRLLRRLPVRRIVAFGCQLRQSELVFV